MPLPPAPSSGIGSPGWFCSRSAGSTVRNQNCLFQSVNPRSSLRDGALSSDPSLLRASCPRVSSGMRLRADPQGLRGHPGQGRALLRAGSGAPCGPCLARPGLAGSGSPKWLTPLPERFPSSESGLARGPPEVVSEAAWHRGKHSAAAPSVRLEFTHSFPVCLLSVRPSPCTGQVVRMMGCVVPGFAP